MDEKVKLAVETYLCPGCVKGCDLSCYDKSKFGDESCKNHCPGTYILGIGRIYLGMPKGFNRIQDDTILQIFKTFDDVIKVYGKYDKYNVPVWKTVTPEGFTIVRVMQPRLDRSAVHIILENCSDRISCYEVSKDDIEFMD